MSSMDIKMIDQYRALFNAYASVISELYNYEGSKETYESRKKVCDRHAERLAGALDLMILAGEINSDTMKDELLHISEMFGEILPSGNDITKDKADD